MAGYKMNFNQDFTSISVVSPEAGFRIFSINATDKMEEIFARDHDQLRIFERLYATALVVMVTHAKPNSLVMLHFKKKQNICNCNYPSEILSVRMNRTRLIVCLAESIHIHDIRNMKIIKSIENIAPNELGLCSLSFNSHLAFPICNMTGELSIYNASKLKPGLRIQAHESKLLALAFSPTGHLLATASERGTVIRIFCVLNGQRVQEFRRGVKRCVRIASLVFSMNGDFVSATSNTETVHIFRIDPKAVEVTERKPSIDADDVPKKTPTGSADKPADAKPSTSNAAAAIAAEAAYAASATTKTKTAVAPATATATATTTTPSPTSMAATASALTGGWSDYLSKAVSSYLIPTTVSDVLAQDRSFATVVLAQPGLRHVCGLVRIEKELRLLIACEDGFLYVHDFNAERGGQCKLLHVHDLRYALEGVIELNLTDSIHKLSLSGTPISPAKSPGKSCGASVLIENPALEVDNSYASILRGGDGGSNPLTDSNKFRQLMDAIDTPTNLYDERQFPPVAIAAKD